MTRQIEQGCPYLPVENGEQSRTLDRNDSLGNKKLPYGVTPETYGLLFVALRHNKQIFDILDALDR